jgi:hypothetical protein
MVFRKRGEFREIVLLESKGASSSLLVIMITI